MFIVRKIIFTISFLFFSPLLFSSAKNAQGLLQAFNKGSRNLEGFRTLLREGADPNEQIPYGCCQTKPLAVCVASRIKDKNTLAFLEVLQKHPDFRIGERGLYNYGILKKKNNILIEAASSCNWFLVRHLLSSLKIDLTAHYCGYGVLTYAMEGGAFDIVDDLLGQMSPEVIEKQASASIIHYFRSFNKCPGDSSLPLSEKIKFATAYHAIWGAVQNKNLADLERALSYCAKGDINLPSWACPRRYPIVLAAEGGSWHLVFRMLQEKNLDLNLRARGTVLNGAIRDILLMELKSSALNEEDKTRIRSSLDDATSSTKSFVKNTSANNEKKAKPTPLVLDRLRAEEGVQTSSRITK